MELRSDAGAPILAPEEAKLAVLTCGGSAVLSIEMAQAKQLSVKDVLYLVAETLGESPNKLALVHNGSKLQLSNMMQAVLLAEDVFAIQVVISNGNEADWRLEADRVSRETRHRGRIPKFCAFKRHAIIQSVLHLLHLVIGCLSVYCAFYVQPLPTCHAPWSWWYGTKFVPTFFQSCFHVRAMWAMCKIAMRFRDLDRREPGQSALCEDGMTNHYIRKDIMGDATNAVFVPYLAAGCLVCIDVAFVIWGGIMSGTTWKSCQNEAEYSAYLMVASLTSIVLLGLSQCRLLSCYMQYIEDFL